MMALDAPISIDRVALRVHDTEKVGAFYEFALGLTRQGADGSRLSLGAGGRTLLQLCGDPDAPRAGIGDAGLFHTAFLVPRRADLGRWVNHARDAGLRIVGAADHGVSEALYLSDPEGNGIEIYRDRPRTAWPRTGKAITMVNEPLDFQGLAAEADGPWTGVPDHTVIGHVHLQVGAIPEAEAFFGDTLGLDRTQRWSDATFFSSGGYHHHLAANTWNSRNAGRRDPAATGLAEVTLRVTQAERDVLQRRTGAARFTDPWGNAFALTS